METVEGLVSAVSGKSDTLGLNVRIAVRELDSRISDAIMHAMEDGPRLEEKVSGIKSLRVIRFEYRDPLIRRELPNASSKIVPRQ